MTASNPVRPGSFDPSPAPKPKMTDQDIRLECAKLAVQSQPPTSQIVEIATAIYGFVKG